MTKSPIKIIKTKLELRAFHRKLRSRGAGDDADIIVRVRGILDDIRENKDKALLSYTKQFDGHGKIRLSAREISAHAGKADKKIVSALKKSAKRIREFHSHQLERSWSFREPDGTVLGQIITPLNRAGIYVPGGRASYPSTVLMNVIPAQVAGVREIAVTVPSPKGEINPCVMAALEMLKITEVYSIGGAQAIGALAFGTQSVRPVDKIVGPGNIYVATAKRMVFGTVDIDMIAGPSEILVIADETANPAFIAADLLSQAEHDPMASSIVVTDSEALAHVVAIALEAQLKALPRSEIARESLKRYGAIVIVADMKEAAGVSNEIAPEHLEVMTRAPRRMLPMLTNAGAIFLGQWTPEPLGDYAAGPNHTLPTGGTARFSSPLGVYDFLKRTSLLEFTEAGFSKLAPTVIEIAQAEGLSAHARSVRVRLKNS